MASFSGRIRDYLPAITVAVLVIDLVILGMYYTRVSKFFQDTIGNAYDEIALGLEMHQASAIVTSIVMAVLVFGFWFMAMRSFKYNYKAFYLLVPILVIGNLGVMAFDFLLVFTSLEASQGGFGSQPISDEQKYFFYISAGGLALLHQITGALTIWCLVVGRTEESMYEGLQEGDRMPEKRLPKKPSYKPSAKQPANSDEPEEFSFEKPYIPPEEKKPLQDAYKKLAGQIKDVPIMARATPGEPKTTVIRQASITEKTEKAVGE